MNNVPYDTAELPIRFFRFVYRNNTVTPNVIGGVCRDLLADLQATTPYVNRATFAYWRVEAVVRLPDMIDYTSVIVEEIAE